MKSAIARTHRSSGFPHTALVLLAATFSGASQLPAAIVIGVTATTDMGTGAGTSLINTVNGVGLSSYSLTATHAGTTPDNSWVAGPAGLGGAVTGNIDFNLGGTYFIDSFSFWNQNGGGPSAFSGIQGVSVLISNNHGSSFLPLPGGPTVFARVTGSSNLAPEIFTFAPVPATDVRFAVQSNYGDIGGAAFAEVAFNSTPVPEPSAAVILAIGLSGILGRRNRNDHNA